MKRKVSRMLVLCAVAAAASGAAACAAAAPSAPISPSTLSPGLGIDLAQYTRTPQGLYYRDLTEGTGKAAAVNSRVVVAYRGVLANGVQIDSSGGLGINLSSDPIIRGWKLGIPGMKEGGVRILVIAPELGYGGRDAGGVPPGSTLVFQIHLRQVR